MGSDSDPQKEREKEKKRKEPTLLSFIEAAAEREPPAAAPPTERRKLDHVSESVLARCRARALLSLTSSLIA